MTPVFELSSKLFPSASKEGARTDGITRCVTPLRQGLLRGSTISHKFLVGSVIHPKIVEIETLNIHRYKPKVGSESATRRRARGKPGSWREGRQATSVANGQD